MAPNSQMTVIKKADEPETMLRVHTKEILHLLGYRAISHHHHQAEIISAGAIDLEKIGEQQAPRQYKKQEGVQCKEVCCFS